MLYVVGFGCGNREGMTFAAYDAIERSDLVIGYSTYIDLIRQIFPDKPTAETGMRKERERVACGSADKNRCACLQRRSGALRHGGACARNAAELSGC